MIGDREGEMSDGRPPAAIFNEDERKIILTGDPIVWQHGTRVSGRKIIMFLDDDRTIVEGESRVMIEPEGGALPPLLSGVGALVAANRTDDSCALAITKVLKPGGHSSVGMDVRAGRRALCPTGRQNNDL
jgi:hypothetical protein